MSEDLVLFRDDRGRPGLLGLHCSHRLTSLYYGRVEDGGIRCPFHGWLYDVAGHCLEQPAEPEGSTFRERIRHPSYPCEELGGLIFAYLGPPVQRPLLPRYEFLVREDGTRKADFYPINSNYLQNLEGALDTVHFPYLHMDNWSEAKHKLATMSKPTVAFEEADYGIWQTTIYPIGSRSSRGPLLTSFFMPAGFYRVQEARWVGFTHHYQSWYVPQDDEHTLRFQVGFAPFDAEGRGYVWPEDDEFPYPGPQNDYFRDYEHVDTISGIPVNAPGTAIKGFLCQDSMVNESQGPLVNRALEHLGATDTVLMAMRKMMLDAIGEVAQHHDPKHIIRDTVQNENVFVREVGAAEAGLTRATTAGSQRR
ncbi:MAG: phthalate 4,5-dioxygenase [Chloroflexi bacterium]|nr:phthalate 4,5-dioxygenase [Chloroflexota bacterium]